MERSVYLELFSLAEDIPLNDPRPVTVIVRRQLPKIELALAAGYRHKDVHNAITERGIKIAFDDYRRIFMRLRKEAKTRRTLSDMQIVTQTCDLEANVSIAIQEKLTLPDEQVTDVLGNTRQSRHAFNAESTVRTGKISAVVRKKLPFSWNPLEEIDPSKPIGKS
jgi:hypothetical protein